MINVLLFLAQTTQPGATPHGTPPSGMELFLRTGLPIIAIVILWIWFMSRTRRKEQQKFEQMLSSLKRNDRVHTIGGILGTVVEVRGNEVILKVDEANNVKMHFSRGAIKEVIRPAADQ